MLDIKIVIIILVVVSLDANDIFNNGESNCLSRKKNEEIGCSVKSILDEYNEPFRIHEESVPVELVKKKLVLKITEYWCSIIIKHNNKEIVIRRESEDEEHTCPPFCIEPMNIGEVKGIGELEVLEFIKSLNDKKANKLLIDTRSPTLYKISTIPGAINIPYSMLKAKSKYQVKILELLEARREGGHWNFDSVPHLLFFGNSEEESQASEAIKSLLKLDCPASKILYYRGGIKSWKRLGLTLY